MKNPNDENHKIEILFQELRRTEEGNAPAFLDVWQKAVSHAGRSGKSRTVLSFAAAAMAAILLIAVFWLFWNRPAPEAHYPIPTPSISQWKSPTDFLMKPATQSWLNTMPQFGESLGGTQTGSSGNQE